MVWKLVDGIDVNSRSVYINFKAIGVFAALAFAVAGGVHYLHHVQVTRHTPLVLEEAKKRLAKAEYASALAYYETYLGYRPDDAEAIADRALLMAKVVRGRSGAADAFYSLRRALNVAPDRRDLLREFVSLGIQLNRVRECEEELNALLESAPDDPEILLLAARGAVELREFTLARTRYEKLLELRTDNPQIYQALIQVLSQELKDLPAADAVLARWLAAHPDSPEVHAYAALYYFRRGLVDLSEQELARAMSEQPAASPALLRLQSQIARVRRRPLDLEASLSQLVELSDGDRRSEFELVELEISLGRRGAARHRLERIGRDEKTTPEQLWQVVIMLEEAGQSDASPEFRERLKDRDQGGMFSQSLTMRDRMRQKEWSAALEISRPLIRLTNASPRFLSAIALWRADCYEQLGDSDGLYNSLRRAVDASESDVTARSRLAQLLFQTGKLQDAQSEYTLLIQQSPIYAREFVSLLQLALSGQARITLTRPEVDRLFDRWREGAPDQALPVLCQLDLAHRLMDRKEAARLTADGIRTWPQEIGFRLSKIDADRLARNWDAVFAELDEAEKLCGAQAALLGRRIVSLQEAAPDDLKDRMQVCAEQFGRLDRDNQSLVWPLLLQGMQRTGIDPETIAGILKNYGEKNPADFRARLALVQQAVAEGNLEQARQHLDSLRELLGDEVPAYRLALLLYQVKAASLGDAAALAEAHATLASIRATEDKQSTLMLTLAAELDLVDKRPADAVRNLQEALRQGDSRRSTLIRTAALMTITGQLDQIVPFLKSLHHPDADANADENSSALDQIPARRDLPSLRAALEPAVPESWPIALAVFRIDLDQDQPALAVESLQHALRLAPGNSIVWANRLAYLERYEPDGLDAAVSEARRQLKIADQGRILPSLLLRMKRKPEAESLLKSAHEQAGTDPIIFRSYVRLLRQQSGPKSVEDLLVETLAGDESEMSACREVARRELALLWSGSKDYRIYRKALSLSEQIVAEAAAQDEEARLLQAEVCAAHPAHWDGALTAYRKMEESSHQPVRFEGYSGEARLQERRHRWTDERNALLSCRALVPDNPQILTRLLLNAVRRRDAEAANEVHQAVRSATQTPAMLLNADVLQASLAPDHKELVTRILDAYRAGQASRETVQDWLTLLKADQALDALLLGELDPKRIETVVRYVLFLVSRQRAGEALSHLSRLWKAGELDAVAGLAASMAASPHVSPEQLQPLRTAIEKQAAADDDDSIRLLISAAALADHAGDHPAAMSLYRRILAKEPDNIMALNNFVFLDAVSAASPDAESLPRMDLALELVGPLDQLLDTKGVLLLRLGRTPEALECFRRAYEQRGAATHQLHLAWALTDLGRGEEAIELYRQVDAVEPPMRLHPLEKSFDADWRKKAFAMVEQNSDATSP